MSHKMTQLVMLLVLTLVSGLVEATQSPRPPQLLKVFPSEGSPLSHGQAIGAELDFTQGEAADPASLQLLVDGADVTAQAHVTMTRDWPPSLVSISYTPVGLTPGVHGVEVRFRTAGGAILSYSWELRLPAAR